jgi:hypothetical protein
MAQIHQIFMISSTRLAKNIERFLFSFWSTFISSISQPDLAKLFSG